MGQWIPPNNIINCPHCDKSFNYNKINGLAVIQAASEIEGRKKMYSRLVLDQLEDAFDRGNVRFPEVRKALLDKFNDFSRDILTIIGLEYDDIEP